MPKISVVIPYQNHEAFINRAYRSVALQSYSDWELIFVDNGSSDKSNGIVEKIAESDSRVRRVVESRRGIPVARNRGIQDAKGEFLSFLDVDDELKPEKFSALLRAFSREPAVAMAYGQTERVYLDSKRIVVQPSGIARPGFNGPRALAFDWMRIMYRLPQTGATLVKSEVARDLGGFEESLLKGNDDVAFHLKVAMTYPVWFEPVLVVTYYRHSGSEGHRLNQRVGATERYIDVYESWLFEYLKSTGADFEIERWASFIYRGLLSEVARSQTLFEALKHARKTRHLRLRDGSSVSGPSWQLALSSIVPKKLANWVRRRSMQIDLKGIEP